jgi:hypothetical protein
LVYRADSSAVRVEKRNVSGGREVWSPSTADKHVVLPAVTLPAIVITHDCAIDKTFNVAGTPADELTDEERTRRSSKADVSLLPIRRVPQTWTDDQLQNVAAGKVLHQFLLPEDVSLAWPGGYADLRWIVTYRLLDLQQQQRVCTLTADLKAFLHYQLAAFFSWREPA